MADVLVVLSTVVFFAVCVAFVRGCDRIIGHDDDTHLDDADLDDADLVEAVLP